MKFLRKYTAIPAVKYSVIAIASLLWLVGFADQLPDVTQTAKYVGISLLMVALRCQRISQSALRWHLTADGGSGRDGVMRTGRLRLYKAGADHVM